MKLQRKSLPRASGDDKKDARRKEVAENWLRGELGRLSKKNADLEQSMHKATETAAARLHKAVGLLQSKEAFATSFLEKLEVWRQMDASQRAALRVVAEPGLEETQIDFAEPLAVEEEQIMLSDTQRMLRLSSKLGEDGPNEEWNETLVEQDDMDIQCPDGAGPKVSTAAVPDQKTADHSGDGAKVSTEAVPDQKPADHSGDGGMVSAKSVPDQGKADHSGDGAMVSTESVPDQKEADHSGDGAKVNAESVPDQKEADHSGDGAMVSPESVPDQKEADHSGDGAKVNAESVPDQKKADHSGDGAKDSAESDQKKADHSGDGAKVSDMAQSAVAAAPVPSAAGLAEHLESLLDQGEDKDKDGCVSEAESLIVADDDFLEAQLAKLILKASRGTTIYVYMYMCVCMYIYIYRCMHVHV